MVIFGADTTTSQFTYSNFRFSCCRKSIFCFAGSFPHFSQKSPWFVENQFTLILFDIFLWKFKHLPSCSQHSLNLKQNKVDLIAKPTFQEAIQCHHTQKLLRYNPYINIPLYQIKNHCLFLISVMLYWASASGWSKFALTVTVFQKLSYTYKIALPIKEPKIFLPVIIKTGSFKQSCAEHF